ncbi:TonB-dependent siderophore receptor [Agarivorans sp. Z349TD_8]|uniref:TonB-dependent siderophore receptor n=1 Tax=Agarivorans sp. Z349TD_8 TaxID=3421434 RepID=UPI003D7EED28
MLFNISSRQAGQCRVVLGFTLLVCPRLLYAATESSLTKETLELTVMKVQAAQDRYRLANSSLATRTATSFMDIPKSITVVSLQLLKDRSSDSLIDALSHVSGVSETNTIGGKEDAIIRRGFGSSRDGSLLSDGLKTAFPHSFNVTTAYVEVLKGPSSTLYGVLDPSGMVNVVSKKPQQIFSAEVWSKYSALGAGRFGEVLGGDLTGQLGNSDFSYRMIGEFEDSDYWRNFGQNRNWTIAPSLLWQGMNTEVLLSYTHQQYLAPYDRGTIFDVTQGDFVATDPRLRFDEVFSEIEGDSDLAKLALNHHLNASWDVALNYAYSQDDFVANQVRTRGYDSATGNVTRRADVRDYYKRSMHAVRSDLTGQTASLGGQHHLLLGASFDHETTRRSKLQNCNTNSDFNIYDPLYGQMQGCDYNAEQAVGEYETITTSAFYLQDQLHLNEQWIAVAGLRMQQFDIDAGRGAAHNTDSSGTALLPNAGLVWKVTGDSSLYANVGQTFRPNSSIGNPYGNLDPEQGTAYEFGSKFDLGQRFSMTLAFYHALKQNVAYSETVNDETVYRTAGQVRSQGIELDVAGELFERLQVVASYGLTDAKVLEDPDYAGKRLANVAKHTASVWLSYDQGSLFSGKGSLRYGGGLRAASKRAGDNNNSFSLPAYSVADVFAAYTFEREHPITVQLNLNNLFNTQYYSSSIGSSAYAVAVGQPFHASLNLSMAFGD